MGHGCRTLLAVIGLAGVFLVAACGGGGTDTDQQPEGTAASRFSGIVASKLAAALGIDGDDQGTPSMLWEAERTSAWKDAELFANRILGEMDAPSLEEMQVSVRSDKSAGSERTVIVRVEVAGTVADYRLFLREVDGQWRVTAYEVADVVEGMGR